MRIKHAAASSLGEQASIDIVRLARDKGVSTSELLDMDASPRHLLAAGANPDDLIRTERGKDLLRGMVLDAGTLVAHGVPAEDLLMFDQGKITDAVRALQTAVYAASRAERPAAFGRGDRVADHGGSVPDGPESSHAQVPIFIAMRPAPPDEQAPFRTPDFSSERSSEDSFSSFGFPATDSLMDPRIRPAGSMAVDDGRFKVGISGAARMALHDPRPDRNDAARSKAGIPALFRSSSDWPTAPGRNPPAAPLELDFDRSPKNLPPERSRLSTATSIDSRPSSHTPFLPLPDLVLRNSLYPAPLKIARRLPAAAPASSGFDKLDRAAERTVVMGFTEAARDRKNRRPG